MIPGVLTDDLRAIVEGLTPLLAQFAQGDCGIAIGGAHAKGVADDESDLDLYVFCDDIPGDAARTERTEAFLPGITEVVSWGAGTPFVQAGTDFLFEGRKVECWFRSRGRIERAVAECLSGTVRRELVTWTPTGFYNHCALSDLKAMIPVDDPAGLLAGWKARIASYPPRLRQAIVAQHLQAAAFWPANFHYSSAVARADVIYTSAIVQQVVHDLIQVLFALNETYFPGDKKLATALARLERAPAGIAERVLTLLAPGETLRVEALRRQQSELQALLADVQVLARDTLEA